MVSLPFGSDASATGSRFPVPIPVTIQTEGESAAVTVAALHTEYQRLHKFVETMYSELQRLRRDLDSLGEMKKDPQHKAAKNALRDVILHVPSGGVAYFQLFPYFPSAGHPLEATATLRLHERIAVLPGHEALFRNIEKDVLKKAAAKRLSDLRLDTYNAFQAVLKERETTLQIDEGDLTRLEQMIAHLHADSVSSASFGPRKRQRSSFVATTEFVHPKHYAHAFLVLVSIEAAALASPSPADQRFNLLAVSNEIYAFIMLRLAVSLASVSPKVFANFSNWLLCFKAMPILIQTYKALHPTYHDTTRSQAFHSPGGL